MSVSVTNSDASLAGKTLATTEGNQTITGLKSYDRGTSAPFAVVAGAAKVSNLDVDKLDGQEGTDYHDAAQLTGLLPGTVIEADPNADRIVFWDDSANALKYLSLTNAFIVGTSLVPESSMVEPCGRLSLTSATPLPSADVTAATTLYYSLFKGCKVPLYNGTFWQDLTIAELSLAVPNVADKMHDLFIDYNGGTPALTATAWTNDTTRATGLVLQNGRLVLSGTPAKLYVGSFRTTSVSGQTEDSKLRRLLFNYFHQIDRPLRVSDSTDNWSYSTATIRQARASAANQVDFVVGVDGMMLQLMAMAGTLSSAAGGTKATGIGINSTTAFHADQIGGEDGAATIIVQQIAKLTMRPAVGYSYAAWLEKGTGSATDTWYGDNGSTAMASGLSGSIRG